MSSSEAIKIGSIGNFREDSDSKIKQQIDKPSDKTNERAVEFIQAKLTSNTLNKTMKVTDDQLVKRVQNGDSRAFDLLVLKYQSKIQSLISRYIRDHSEVQDVAQEAFIKAYRAIGNFRAESAFYTWMYRIAINTAKNYLVSRSRRPPSTDVDIDESEDYAGANVLYDIETPENLIHVEEIAMVVNKALAGLPEDLRTAVTLREFDGLSYEDIAEVMSCPVGTVRSRIFRAREAIDKQLKPRLEASS